MEFVEKHKKNLGYKGDWKKGEIEIVRDPKLFKKCEESAAQQMIKQGISESDAKERAQIGIRDRNRWGTSVCEPVKLPTGKLGTFVRFIPWGQLKDGIAGYMIMPVLSDDRFVFLKNFRNATRRWVIEFPRGAHDPGESMIKILKEELKFEIGGEMIEKPRLVGKVNPDSGVLSGDVEVYLIKTKTPMGPKPEITEAIGGLVLLPKREIDKLIKDGEYKDKEGRVYEFSDGFSMSAILMAKEKKLI